MENIKSVKAGQRPIKKCTVCKEVKELSEFYKDKSRKDGLQYSCKSCESKAHKKKYAENEEVRERKSAYAKKRRAELDEASKEKIAEQQRQHHLYKRYGLTIEQYDEMHNKQGGKCAICKGVDTRGPSFKLSIDHCHDSGNIRGLLCGNCNRALGLLGDTAEGVKKAYLYLRKPPVIAMTK